MRIAAALFLLIAVARAEDPAEAVDEYVRARSGYTDEGFGGPTSVGTQLANDNRTKPPLFRAPGVDRALKPWFDMKGRVRERIGLQFGFNYTALGQWVTDSPGADSAIGGVLEILATWTLVGRESKNHGNLVFKLENRHRLGTDLSPFDLGFEAGSTLPIAVKFNDFGWGVTNLFWQQRLLKGRMTIVAGKVDVTDYMDVYGLINPLTSFHNFAFSTNPTIAVPDQGLGAAVGGALSDHWYAVASLVDANGSPTESGFDTFFDESEFFTHVEVGFTSNWERRYLDNIHFVIWHADERQGAGSPEGWGVAFSAAWFFEDKWMPFLRAGWSDGDASLLNGVVSAGLGIRFKSDDVFGVGLSWGRPASAALRDQYTAEVFYRFYVTQNFFLAPNLQFIVHPALAPDQDAFAALGLKVRLTF